jgi:hypothetical protein
MVKNIFLETLPYLLVNIHHQSWIWILMAAKIPNSGYGKKVRTPTLFVSVLLVEH